MFGKHAGPLLTSTKTLITNSVANQVQAPLGLMIDLCNGTFKGSTKIKAYVMTVLEKMMPLPGGESPHLIIHPSFPFIM